MLKFTEEDNIAKKPKGVDLIRLEGYQANFFRGAPLWKEVAWVICKNVFFLPRFPLPSRFRVLLLRLFGATVGEGTVLRGGINITHPWRLVLGDHVWIGEDVLIHNLSDVIIESNCCISQKAFLCAASHNFLLASFDLILKPIRVSSHSWIAAQVFVGPGVTIGSGSMARAGSVVLESVPARTIVQGNPAIVHRTLDGS